MGKEVYVDSVEEEMKTKQGSNTGRLDEDEKEKRMGYLDEADEEYK